MDVTDTASLPIPPKHNQAFPVVLVCLGGTCLPTAFLFAWHDKNFWIPLVSGFVLISVAALLWLKSHRVNDLKGAHPTSMVLPNGAKFDADMRTLESPRALKAITDLLNLYSNIKPLPAADGVVDDSGGIVKNSSQQAADAVDKVNAEVQSTLNKLGSKFTSDSSEPQEFLANPPIDPETLNHNSPGI
ncbi:hypothetical protein [Cellvibrio sp. UBA7661]|uniref:hypothetical protein n=1 Tax=Cellvibrio sp. UBA7661 TaxID=1946311 RepID=UPI002F35E862